jgi:hypothetical protein
VSNLEPRGGRRLSRSQRESRAFSLVVASGVFGLLALVTFVLAIAGTTGFGWFVIFLIAAGVSLMFLRRSVN